jgi:hypothetical protein
MNYDFKINWDTIVLPLLSHPTIKKNIKKGIQNYIKDGNCYKGTEYNPDKCPASYGRGDSWNTYISDYEEHLVEKLLETCILKKDENKPLNEDEFDDYLDSENFEKYSEYKNIILKPFIKYHEITSLRAYQMFGACHWWNPTFSLSLAKLIYPNEKWFVKSGEHHTTIVNSDEKLVFDILYFNEKDETKGGKEAINDTLRK